MTDQEGTTTPPDGEPPADPPVSTPGTDEAADQAAETEEAADPGLTDDAA